MRRIICYTLAVFFASILGVAAFAQTAQFSGRVTDPQEKVVVGANVRIFNQATGIEHNVKTNSDGLYVAPFIQSGTYQIYVQASGFSTVSSQPLTVTVDQALVFDVQLKVGNASEHVTVNANDQEINTTDASVSTVIDRRFVENIPLNGRSFQDLISMTPGVVTQSPQSSSGLAYNGDFSVNGQRTESNYYMVDGVTGNTQAGNGYGGPQSGTSGSLGASTALGTTQSLVSVDALQEFRVLSSTYSAEYGRTPGGQFSLVTRSGTNAPHGTLFDYLRNSYFDANDWFNDHYGQPIAALRQNDFGGTLGGPVFIPRLYDGRNKTFLFSSYEGLRLAQPQAAAIQYVPDSFMRQQAPAVLQPILNAFPIQNGLDYGSAQTPSLAQFIKSYSLPSQIDSTSIRLDQTLGEKFSAFFRFSDTPTSTSSRSLSAVSTTAINTQTYTLGATGQFTSKIATELRLGYSRGGSYVNGKLDSFGGADPIDLASALAPESYVPQPIFILNFAGIGGADLSYSAANNQSRQWNTVDTVTIAAGHHQIKLGIDYRRIKSPTDPPATQVYSLYYSPQAVLTNVATLQEVVKISSYTPVFNETAAFVQDEWRVSPRLSVSSGLRWEVNPAPTEAHGNDAYTLLGSISDPASLQLAPQGTSLWRTTWYNFAPRLGVAWQAHTNPGWETVLRAGAGVFFDTDNQFGVDGFIGIGHYAYQLHPNLPTPLAPAQLDFSPSATPPFTSETAYAFPAHLQLPYTLEWNVSLQQSLGKVQAVTMSYVASNGRRLIGSQTLSVAELNPNFGEISYFDNRVTSNYQSLQIQFQRSVAHGLHALASYTWSHSLDFGSTGSEIPLTRGNSDFDVRNNFVGGLSWDAPHVQYGRLLDALTNGWGIDGRLSARTAFPVSLDGNTLIDATTGQQYFSGLNVVQEQPTYLFGSQYPGGKIINKAAFIVPSGTSIGDAPRNFVRGFGATQINLAVRRTFSLYDKLALQFRAEAFNILNQPNFGYVDPYYTDATFGQATTMLNGSLGTMSSQYQQGGARSLQFALKLVF